MIKQIGKLSVFSTALLIAVAVFIYWHAADRGTAEAQTGINSNANVSANAPPRQDPIIDDFVPEISGLPAYVEMEESTANVVPLNARLIDIAEFQRNENSWPSYSRTELEVQSGDKWLGLYTMGRKVNLAETRVTRAPRRGYLGPGDEPQDWLKYERKGELRFLVKGIRNLTAGEVPTLFLKLGADAAVSLHSGFRQTFRLAGRNFVLRVTTGLQGDGEKVNVLILESEGRSQVVTFNHYYRDHNTLYNSIGELLWAGDIDGDEKLDFYFSDFGYEKGGFRSNLYLSSPAKGDNLVERVARFSSAGC